jgi:hypothetical protein
LFRVAGQTRESRARSIKQKKKKKKKGKLNVTMMSGTGCCPDGYDASVWASLPVEIQQELLDATTGTSTALLADVDRNLPVDHSSTVRETFGGLRSTEFGTTPARKRDFAEYALDDAEYEAVLLSLGIVESASPSSHVHTTKRHAARHQVVNFGRRVNKLGLPCYSLNSADQSHHSTKSLPNWTFALPSDQELILEAESHTSTHDQTPPIPENIDSWTDPDFPPDVSSLDGIKGVANTINNATPKCRCGKAAKLQQVHKENMNQGRKFYGCAARKPTDRCGFFQWAQLSHSEKDLQMTWKRLEAKYGYVVVRDGRFRPEDVCQGAVGDCWMLSVCVLLADGMSC